MKIKSITVALFGIIVILAGCKSSGPIQIKPNAFLITKKSAGGMFVSGNEVRIEIIKEATNYCNSKELAFNLLSSKQQDVVPMVSPPSAEIEFSCVPKDDFKYGFTSSVSNNQKIDNNAKAAEISTIQSSLEANKSYSRRIAFVLGNSGYKIRPLKNSRNDADDMSQTLRDSGFDVIDLRDANLPQMRAALREFGDKLMTYDVGLVYYSGHGVEVKGRNYFIPVNAEIMREDEIADQGLDVSLILEKMNTAGKGVNILIVDACRDDPFGRSFRSSSRGLAQMDAPRGTIIAYATSPGKVASDGDPRERNSPYTKNLVKAMQQPNKPIEQVFKEVRRAVQEETKNQQTPWENTSLSGDFYFKVQR
jgi:hypothetical protein